MSVQKNNEALPFKVGRAFALCLARLGGVRGVKLRPQTKYYQILIYVTIGPMDLGEYICSLSGL